jgi:deoxycytidylate deaminase
MTEWEALAKAVEAAGWSGCQKSQRGVVIWQRKGGVLSVGYNSPVMGKCDGSAACRRDCAKLCVHAEQHALQEAAKYGKGVRGAEMLHVKVVNGQAVVSGPPSCWQCSRSICQSNLAAMWLLHEGADGDPQLVRYDTMEFHRLTLEQCGIHPYSDAPEPEDDTEVAPLAEGSEIKPPGSG